MQHQSYSPYAFSPNADAYGPDFSYRSPSTNEYHEPTPSIEMQVEARPAETYVNPFAEAYGFAAPPVSPEYFASHTPVASPLEYSRPFNPRGVSVVDEQETSIMSTSGLSSFAQGSDKYESNYSRALSSNRVASTSYNSPFSRLQSGGQSISPSFGPPPSTTPSFPAASYSAYNPYAHRPTGPPTAPSHRLPTLPSHVQTFTPSAFSHNPSDPFDYRALGFSAPPPQPLAPSSFKNIYSSSGFDLTRLLARVVERENPVIELGAIDASCSFVVVDARKADQPIVYASETFSKLTGYSNEEIVGRNCRFLQAPGGHVVEQGAKRLYTDGNAVHHLRQHLVRGEEAQVSLINYTKEGRPFINLTTVIPITLSRDSQVIEYFVGFQVDLVDQPQAIREKTPTSYVVDYTRSVLTAYRVPSVASTVDLENAHAMARQVAGGPSSATLLQEVKEEPRESSPDLIELVAHNSHGLNGLSDDGVRKQFNRLLVDSCPDIILVVSLKGTLLYVSAASERILGYSDLTGKTLASFCHPSDIVTVQRELKEAGALAANGVNIVFRMRTTSGYVFVEASGRLHVDPGKGRKCVILTMRPHEVCLMSWRDLEASGGLSSSPVDEFFAKVCVDAIFLQATKAAEQVLGVKNVDSSIVGMSIGDLSPPGTDDAQRATDALLQASRGNVTSVQHKLRGGDGRYIDVVTRFYPRGDQDSAPSKLTAVGGKALSVIAQVSLLSSEPAKQQQRAKLASSLASSSAAGTAGSSSSRRSDVGSYATAATSLARSSFSHYQPSPHLSGGSTIGAPVMSAALPGASSSSGNFSFSVSAPSTFKNLATPSHAVSDNIFEELEGTRGTSWQFELHQMRLTNKKLREERDALEAIRKRKTSAANAPPAPVMKKSAASQRACANCGRTTSSEWRSGPTGSKTLCNACGLRWSKSKSQAAAAEKKRKAEAAQVAAALAAASPPPPAHNFASPSGGSSSEETGFRRDSGTGSGNGSGGDSTDPTTASPAMSPYQQSPFCAGPNEYFGNGSGKNGVAGAAAVGGSGGMYPHPPAYSYAQRPHLPHQPSSLYPYSPNAG